MSSLKKLRENKGVSVVLLALMVVVLFGFGALAIDIGHLYHVEDQLQVAADAAALAGAGELSGADDAAKTANAKAAAVRIGAKNAADVASTALPTANPGEPIPVTLDPANDIQVGYWDGTHFNFPATGPLNAVRVFARRTDARPDQPKSSNYFAKVFALLGPNFDFTAVTAVAIAAKEELELLPIAVNEYWNEGGAKAGDPYGQAYPQSFMRQTNAINTDGSSNGAGRAGTTENVFAVLGVEAGSNNESFNLNSFVDILHRNRFHTPVVSGTTLSDNGDQTAWYLIKEDTTTGTCSPSCPNNLTALPGGVKGGDVNPGKFDENFEFLFTGIPDDIIPPNAVFEIARPTPPYPGDNYNNTTTFNDPSNCPFASIPYFSGSGNIVQQKGPEGDNFQEKWPKGSRFMVMVYDGTLTTNPDPDQANVITIIGYGIIEVDGYMNGNFDGNPASLGDKGGTAYGHAIPHGVSGQTDPYLIQPPSSPANDTTGSARKGDCSFTEIITNTKNTFGGVRLVGVHPDVCYGTAEGPNCPQ